MMRGIASAPPIRRSVRLVARFAAGAYLACAAWLGYQAVSLMAKVFHDESSTVFELLLMPLIALVVFGSLATLLIWIAFRLWLRLDASAVRWATGTLLAFAAMTAVALIDEAIGDSSGGWVSSIAPVPALILCAIAFRKLNARIFVWSRIDDPKDLLGQPQGHEARVKTFCSLLGWAVFFAGTLAVPRFNVARGPGWLSLLTLLPPVLGWLAYRVTLWRMTPRTQPAVPTGGFEVVPVAAHVSLDEERIGPIEVKASGKPAGGAGTTRA